MTDRTGNQGQTRKPAPPVRIAMWSGPRNISTAMMRSFGNRPDTAVWDEPFYAAFLKGTGIDHPMREDVLKTYETDWRKVTAALLGPVPGGRPIHYQKHMTHHMLPDFDLGWTGQVTNGFLIRRPENVLASYAAKRAEVTLEDIGFAQQARIFDLVCDRLGHAPPVIDAADILADPPATVAALCTALEIPFSPAMLDWPSGRRDTDGIWAAHWYGAVEASTGFARSRPDVPRGALPAPLARLAERAWPFYERLRAHRLAPAGDEM